MKKYLFFILAFMMLLTSCNNKNSQPILLIKGHTVGREDSFFSNIHMTHEFIYNNVQIPVILYHSVDTSIIDITTGQINESKIAVDSFREQMEYLKKEGYYTLSPEEFYDFRINDKPIPKKSILLTFDDGYKDNYINALPILNSLKLKAVLFTITDVIDNHQLYLTTDQLAEFEKDNISIESHTTMHQDLSKLTYEEQLKILKDSKDALEKMLNKKIDFIAYPYGHYNNHTFEAAKNAGYKCGFITGNTWPTLDDDVFSYKRTYILGTDSLDTFIRKITNP